MSEVENVSIQEVADCFTGYPFPSKQFLTPGHGMARVFRGDNLKEGYSEWGDKEKRWEQITPDLQRYQLEAGDVLIGMDGSKVGKNWTTVLESDLPALLGQRVCRIRASELGNQEFLFHVFGSNLFRSYVEQVKTGTSIPHISNEQIKNFCIAVPPLPEQKKIAEILSGIDKLIGKLLEAIAKSETTLIGVFADLDLIASSGKTSTLGEAARVQNGYAFQSSVFSEDPADIPLVRISNISRGGVDISKSKRIPRGLVPSNEYKVNRGDILIAMSGATTGKIGKYQGDVFCLLNQRVGKFVFHSDSGSAAYAKQLLLSGFLESRILAKAAGGAQPNISSKGIENIEIPFPSAEDQEKYGSTIKELLRVNSTRTMLVEKYQELKASIASDLLSGRKRVSV